MPPLFYLVLLAVGPTLGDAPEPAEATVLIPAGSFTMGGGEVPDQQPERTVVLSAYRIDRFEVSLAQFEAFAAGPAEQREHWSDDGWAWHQARPQGAGAPARRQDRGDDHPVLATAWYEAQAYCSWQGGRLPSEAEWERAARGEDQRRFPWGGDERDGVAWFLKERRQELVSRTTTLPVREQDTALASPFGLLHMAGNAQEWTADTYHRAAYSQLPERDPLHVADGPWKVLRGGSFQHLASYCTTTHREPARPDEPRPSTGFRCAYTP